MVKFAIVVLYLKLERLGLITPQPQLQTYDG